MTLLVSVSLGVFEPLDTGAVRCRFVQSPVLGNSLPCSCLLSSFFSLKSRTSSRFLAVFCNLLATIPGPGALQTIWSVVPLPMMMQRATVFRPRFFARVGTTLWATSCKCPYQVWSRDNWDSAVIFHAIYFGANDAICNVQCSTPQVFVAPLLAFAFQNDANKLVPTVAEHVGATPSESTGHCQSLQRGVGLHARRAMVLLRIPPSPTPTSGRRSHSWLGSAPLRLEAQTAFIIADEASKSLDDPLESGHQLELERDQLLFASITGVSSGAARGPTAARGLGIKNTLW